MSTDKSIRDVDTGQRVDTLDTGNERDTIVKEESG